MANVKILVRGYLPDDTEKGSCSTISLVQDKDLNIVVDPGTLKDPDLLVKSLADHDLKTDDINIIFLTHSHMDHYRNIGLFPKAKALDYWGYWEKDLMTDADEKITDDLSFIRTPGHSDDSITLLVKTDKGLIAICGDVFWKENFPEKDKYATDPKKLEESRKKILETADFVIPGHGEMFDVEK